MFDHTVLVMSKIRGYRFANCGNGEIDVKSGCSSLVRYATMKWVHNLDSASKGGSDEFINFS